MLVIPAIDLMNGQIVRLRQGRAEDKTVYSDNPPEFAQKWEAAGAQYIHVVDLDGAFTGQPANLDVVRRIVENLNIPVQLGGGLRTKESVTKAISAGVQRVILGTRAAESLDFVAEIANLCGPSRVAVGVDARNGVVATKGWTESGGQSALQLVQHAVQAGAGTVIYTDIATDGMLQGPNLKEIEVIAAAVDCNLIASGGVSSLEDVRALAAIPGIGGVIVGKALFENRLDLAEAILAAAHPA